MSERGEDFSLVSAEPGGFPPNVILGANAVIDAGVSLGCAAGRSIPDLTLLIGNGARIRSGTVIYAGTSIGEGLATGHHVVIREQNVLGNDVNIWSHSNIDYGCRIGNSVRIHSNVYVAQFTTIEDDVFLAPGVVIANDPHPLCRECTEDGGPLIERGARIGINATILPGVVVGRCALVGAASVVTKDVPGYAIVAGNPARVIGCVHDLRCPHDPDGRAYVDGRDRASRASRAV